jgi:hypothetical protein
MRNPEENIKKMNANKTPLAYTIAIKSPHSSSVSR